MNIPEHVAIIMDGNGRWATNLGKNRTTGHTEGMHRLYEVVVKANEMKIKVLTVFAFSTENWSRPEIEKNHLFKIPAIFFNRYFNRLDSHNIKVMTIGDLEPFPLKLKDNLQKVIYKTKDNSGLIINIALNYGSKSEIVQMVKKIAFQVKSNTLHISDISEQVIEQNLMTFNLPPVDFLIRTSNELRISNFLLWQIAYSELYFTPKLWPDFKSSDFEEAIIEYSNRKRRFGGI